MSILSKLQYGCNQYKAEINIVYVMCNTIKGASKTGVALFNGNKPPVSFFRSATWGT